MTITELTKLWFNPKIKLKRDILFTSGEVYGINNEINFKVRLSEDSKIISVGIGPSIESAFRDAFCSLPDSKAKSIGLK